MVTRKKAAPKAAHEDVVVKFTSLHFDPKNPRGEFEDDEDKIRALFAAQPETATLATHIAKHGQNPLDRLGVVAHPKLPGHFVIREGNRRLCALQLLRDPARGPTLEVRKAFQRIASIPDARPVPNEISVVLFHEPPEARVWMSVKHEGQQNGIGTRPWGPSEKTRFNREGETGTTRPKNPNRQAEALVTYAVSRSLITPEERALIALSTLTRYLPNVRGALALLNNEDCTTNARQSEFDAALTRFLKDAKETGKPGVQSKVHSRSRKTERDAYAETLRASNLSPTNRDQAPYDPSQGTPSKPAAKSRGQSRGATNPDRRKYLIESSFVVRIKDGVLQRLVAEGKQQSPDDAPFSCNYLNRAILERVVYQYARKFCGGGQGQFQDVVPQVLSHAQGTARPPSKGVVGVLRKAGDQKTGFSYAILSNGVHGGTVPTGVDNRRNWDNLLPALSYLLEQL